MEEIGTTCILARSSRHQMIKMTAMARCLPCIMKAVERASLLKCTSSADRDESYPRIGWYSSSGNGITIVNYS